MRQILIDLARRRRTATNRVQVRAALAESDTEISVEEVVALGDALQRLGEVSPRLRSIVEYRYFAGLNEAEIAEILQVSTRTVERDWVKARLWLHHALYPEPNNPT
jgi:RNA polymerase sigma factor (TIGR02999 family)